jgi:hypothetical protein
MLEKKKKPADSNERTASKGRLEFEKFLADLSARFVSLHPEEVDNEINNALKGILRFFRSTGVPAAAPARKTYAWSPIKPISRRFAVSVATPLPPAFSLL